MKKYQIRVSTGWSDSPIKKVYPEFVGEFDTRGEAEEELEKVKEAHAEHIRFGETYYINTVRDDILARYNKKGW